MSVIYKQNPSKIKDIPTSLTIKSVGVIGSLQLSYTIANDVGHIVEDLITRKYHIATGGAIGADQYVIEHLLHQGLSDHCTVYSSWQNYRCVYLSC